MLAKEDHLLNPAGHAAPGEGATGRPAVGVRIRIADDAGRDVKQGEIGEILIVGSHVMSCYWRNPEATAETLRDGWVHTGNMGCMDAAGYVYVVDRKKDMIISGGFNVYSREVEDALHRHSGVKECAVYGADDPVWGEAVAAAVIRNGERRGVGRPLRRAARWLQEAPENPFR